MSKEITKEGNRLIAEFMGEQFIEYHGMLCRCNPEGSPWDNDPIEWLHYERDWSQLMPVVEKISDITIYGVPPMNTDQFVKVEMVPQGYVRIANLRDTPIFANVSIEGSLIAATFKAVTQFIQWYNTHKNNNQ